MADVTYRVNLKASSIPLLSESHGRTVIVKGQDQNYVPGMTEKSTLTDAEKDLGVPQVYYAHNVMPNGTGYQSVGFTKFTNDAELPGDLDFDSTVILLDGAGNAAEAAISDDGDFFVLTALSGKWQVPAVGCPTPANLAGRRMTVAFVSGVTYIYFSNYGCYVYDFATDTMTATTLTGLTAADILGVSGAFGYLLAYSEDAIVWSSTLDATDFVPSLVTGAGGGQVESARGKLVTIEPVYGALIVFTDSNAVAAQYSGNSRYPFNFVPVSGAGGLTDPTFVTQDSGAGSLYAYTTSGLQSITAKAATTVYPELTDFLSGYYFEDFDENLNEFSTTIYPTVVQKRLAYIADRYLVISYGTPTGLTHAIVLDTALKQFGKLKIPHTDCFEFQLYDQDVIEVPKKSIAFLQTNGTVYLLNFDLASTDRDGVMLLGKYQYVRSRLLTLEGVEVENVDAAATFTLHDIPTIDGKTFITPIAGYLASTAAKSRNYRFHNTAMNHSILCKGTFNLHSMLLTFDVHGGR
jgi:hypothetical protein